MIAISSQERLHRLEYFLRLLQQGTKLPHSSRTIPIDLMTGRPLDRCVFERKTSPEGRIGVAGTLCGSTLYTLTTPKANNTRRTNSEIKVRTPQMSVNLLPRTTVSSRLQRRIMGFAAQILPNQKGSGPPTKPE